MPQLDDLVEEGAKELLGYRLEITDAAALLKLWQDIDDRLRDEYRGLSSVVVSALADRGELRRARVSRLSVVA